MQIVLFLCIPFEFLSCNADIQCNTPYGCASSSMSGDDLTCRGYHACDSATWTNSNTGGDEVNCGASYSCYKSNLDHQSPTKGIYCDALYSCADSVNLHSANVVYCRGDESCLDSTIYGGSEITCDGFESCMDAVIYVNGTLTGNGPLSTSNSLIYSVGDEISIDFVGPQSGHGATVFCNSGSICNIYCYEDGCNDLTLTSLGGNFNVSCDNSAFSSDVCPNGEIFSSLVIYTEYPRLTDEEDPDTICDASITGAINCDQWNECDNSALTNYDGPICCTAESTCNSNADLQTYNISNTTAIRCDGESSCEFSNVKAVNGGNIYLTAYFAAEGATIATTMEYNIECTGLQSCYQAENISNAKNVYCLAGEACAEISSISKIKENMYCFGSLSCKDITISYVKNVYGGGYQSCYYGSLTFIENVYVYGYESCYRCSMENIQNTSVYGYQSWYYGSLTSIENVYVYGYQALYGTVVSFVNNLFGYAVF